MQGYTCIRHIISSADDLAPFAADWRRLTCRSNPANQLEWAQATVNQLAGLDGAPHDHVLLALTRGSDPAGPCCAFALMRKTRRQLARELEQAGPGIIFEPTDLIYDGEDSAREILRHLASLRLPCTFPRLPHHSLVPHAARTLSGGGHRVRILSKDRYPFVDLHTHPEADLNSGRRSDLRRMRRKAQEQGGWRFEVLSPTPDELPPLFSLAVDIEARSWKAEGGHALKARPVLHAFYEDYLRRAAGLGVLRMAFGWLGDAPVAMQVAIAHDQGYWLLKIGYDASVAKIAPGQLLMLDVIQDCASKGYRTCEFFGKAADWTAAWTRSEHPSCRVELYPASLQSALRLAELSFGKVRDAARPFTHDGNAMPRPPWVSPYFIRQPGRRR